MILFNILSDDPGGCLQAAVFDANTHGSALSPVSAYETKLVS